MHSSVSRNSGTKVVLGRLESFDWGAGWAVYLLNPYKFFFLLQGSFRFLTGCFLPPFVSGLQLSFLLEKFIENVNGLKG